MIWVPLENLRPGDDWRAVDPGGVEALAAAIEESGWVAPLLVQPTAEPDVYEIVAGHRRFAALKLLRHKSKQYASAPARVVTSADAERRALGVVENAARAELRPIDFATAVKRLRAKGHTDKAIAKRTAKSEPFVRRAGALLDALAPEVVGALQSGADVPMSTLLKWAPMPADYQREELEKWQGKQRSGKRDRRKHAPKAASRRAIKLMADLRALNTPETRLAEKCVRWVTAGGRRPKMPQPKKRRTR